MSLARKHIAQQVNMSGDVLSNYHSTSPALDDPQPPHCFLVIHRSFHLPKIPNQGRLTACSYINYTHPHPYPHMTTRESRQGAFFIFTHKKGIKAKLHPSPAIMQNIVVDVLALPFVGRWSWRRRRRRRQRRQRQRWRWWRRIHRSVPNRALRFREPPGDSHRFRCQHAHNRLR